MAHRGEGSERVGGAGQRGEPAERAPPTSSKWKNRNVSTNMQDMPKAASAAAKLNSILSGAWQLLSYLFSCFMPVTSSSQGPVMKAQAQNPYLWEKFSVGITAMSNHLSENEILRLENMYVIATNSRNPEQKFNQLLEEEFGQSGKFPHLQENLLPAFRTGAVENKKFERGLRNMGPNIDAMQKDILRYMFLVAEQSEHPPRAFVDLLDVGRKAKAWRSSKISRLQDNLLPAFGGRQPVRGGAPRRVAHQRAQPRRVSPARQLYEQRLQQISNELTENQKQILRQIFDECEKDDDPKSAFYTAISYQATKFGSWPVESVDPLYENLLPAIQKIPPRPPKTRRSH